jgi:hypothetical protein
MPTPHIVVRAGNPDFLDLPWDRSLVEWRHPRRLELPKGISRHEVHFYGYDEGIFAIKELPNAAARHEYEALRALEELDAPTVRPVGLVERPWVDPTEEWSAAVITAYLPYAFSYRELLSGWGFGDRRSQMLDAFAGLLVELHVLGCYWGDCSLSNALYRYDAGAIEVTMVDAETAELRPELSDGQRGDDLAIMIQNVAGGMADIAASHGVEIDEADLALGEDIARRYEALWTEITRDEVIRPDERYRITEQIRRINALGFDVSDLELIPDAGGDRVRMHVKVGGRQFHGRRLRELTGLDAGENQARQILSDLSRYEGAFGTGTASGKAVSAVRWRVEVFEPLLARITALDDRRAEDPIQAFADFLHHRYEVSAAAGRDIHNDEAFELWLEADQPGYPIG